MPKFKTPSIRCWDRLLPRPTLTSFPPDEDVREALDIDSFDFLNFLIGLNEALGVEIPEADYGKLVSLNDITTYLADTIRMQ